MQELDRAGQAKAAMFPQAHPSGSSRDPQDPSHHLYVTSHGAYGAGEQRHRHYDWDRTGLDPATHSFGEALQAVDWECLHIIRNVHEVFCMSAIWQQLAPWLQAGFSPFLC